MQLFEVIEVIEVIEEGGGRRRGQSPTLRQQRHTVEIRKKKKRTIQTSNYSYKKKTGTRTTTQRQRGHRFYLPVPLCRVLTFVYSTPFIPCELNLSVLRHDGQPVLSIYLSPLIFSNSLCCSRPPVLYNIRSDPSEYLFSSHLISIVPSASSPGQVEGRLLFLPLPPPPLAGQPARSQKQLCHWPLSRLPVLHHRR